MPRQRTKQGASGNQNGRAHVFVVGSSRLAEQRGALLRRRHHRTAEFKSEAEEREFWLKADSTEYVDWAAATPMRFPNLRPSSTAISVRLPDTLLTELKLLANERDVPYQSLLK